MIVDGRALAGEVLSRTKTRAFALGRELHVAVVVTSETPATKSYLAIKEKRAMDAGCVLDIVRFPKNTGTAVLGAIVHALDADAVLAQLPLASGIDTKEVCDAILLTKDADVLSAVAREKFGRGDADALLPPVVAAVREILIRNGVKAEGKKAVVIGDGWLVGKPCATWLAQQGADVSVLTSKSNDLSASLQGADIIVSGAGVPHLIKPDMLKEAKTAGGSSPDGSSDEPFRGVVLIDAGTSESDGTIAGDADPRCAEKCSVFTPVPGGVGPVAVAMLFENAVTLLERATDK